MNKSYLTFSAVVTCCLFLTGCSTLIPKGCYQNGSDASAAKNYCALAQQKIQINTYDGFNQNQSFNANGKKYRNLSEFLAENLTCSNSPTQNKQLLFNYYCPSPLVTITINQSPPSLEANLDVTQNSLDYTLALNILGYPANYSNPATTRISFSQKQISINEQKAAAKRKQEIVDCTKRFYSTLTPQEIKQFNYSIAYDAVHTYPFTFQNKDDEKLFILGFTAELDGKSELSNNQFDQNLGIKDNLEQAYATQYYIFYTLGYNAAQNVITTIPKNTFNKSMITQGMQDGLKMNPSNEYYNDSLNNQLGECSDDPQLGEHFSMFGNS